MKFSKITHHLFLTAVFLLLNLASYSQTNPVIDSLKQALTTAKNDTTRCKALGLLIELLDETEWPVYNQQLSSICEKQLKEKTPFRLFYLKYMATALSNTGLSYENQGDAANAAEYYHKSLRIQEEIKDRDGISSTFYNLGGIYFNQNDNNKALEYYEKSLKKSEEICENCQEKQDRGGMAFALVNIGLVYQKKEDTVKALQYLNKSLQLMQELGNKQGSSFVLNCIGSFYYKYHNLPKALEFYTKSKDILEEIHDSYGMAFSYNNIASILFDQGKISEAEKFGLQSFKLSKELGFPSVLKFSSNTMSKIYSKTGNWKGAYEMQVLFKQMNDSIASESNRKASLYKDFQYRYEKKAAADSVKVVAERRVFDVQIKQEKTQRIASYIVILLVFVFSVFMYNRFRITNKQKKLIEIKEKETQQQKHIIEEKHREISDSINYAERIQRSFIATKELLDANLKDYFVLFKPKDVVSGDFYWGSNLPNHQFILTTADSTGHGVPGAIMSLLNITSLEKAIEHHSKPSEILNHARKIIIERLKKDGSQEGGKDGMDCSALVFDFENHKLQIAAAHNPVWIIRKKELMEIKGDKMPVGKHDRDQVSFTLHTIQLEPGDVVYTLTDGFADQFGGDEGKKFMSKNLRELLLANAHLPMESQKQLLETTFKNWLGNLEQVDDVTIIGVRV